jgi:hypothetical protein
MKLLSSLVSFSELKNRQNELRCRLEPQTLLLCRRHPWVLNSGSRLSGRNGKSLVDAEEDWAFLWTSPRDLS